MADSVPENLSASGLPVGHLAPRRTHSYSRLTTAIAVLALATAAYSVWRLDSTRDRLDHVNELATKLAADRELLHNDIKDLTERESSARRELERRLETMEEVPKQVQELNTQIEELRGRAEGPERAWSRAEAAFLMELAQSRLTLDRDVDTAVVALESADSRLAALRDPGVTAVRQQLAKEIQALRSVRRVDTTGILVRLANAEEQAASLPVRGIVAVERSSPTEALPEGMLSRAWTVARNAISGLLSVRKIDDRAGSVVTLEEQALRRQHLQLLLFSARTAVVRHDDASYRSALAGARQWLGEFFDTSSAATSGLLNEIQALEPIDIDPQLPDVSGSSRILQRAVPARRDAP
ncbi:MAG TPA: uroporphyrinogen-III C-methyltransferase [Steroidobacteraceae bacterium]|jgi:uroporphyrin-3 C-methyltransferase